VTNIQGQVGVIQDSLAALTNLGALASTLTNVDWSAVAGVSSLAGSVSNIQSSVTNISAIQASVNDLADKINGVDWDGLAGVPDSMNQFAPALQGLGTTAGSDIASIMRSVQDLSRQAGQSGTSISDVQSGVRAIQQAMEALNRLQDRLGTGDAGQPTDSLFTRLSVLADNVGKVAGDASDAAKNAMGAKTEAANASAGIQAVKDAMARGDTTGVAAGIDRIREQLAAVRSAIDGISPAKETASMEEAVKKMVAQVEAFSKSTGVKWLTEMKDPPKVGAGEGADEKRVEDLNAVLIEVRGRLEFLQKMIQDLRDKPVVEESLIGG
jgi:prefoldin subunit 5